MLFLGIFFVTSWISGFLSLNQIAVNVPRQIPTAKLSSSSEKATSNQFCSATGSNHESSTLVPKAFNAVKTSVSSAPQLLNSSDNDSDFANKILRSIRSGLPPTLRNLFRLPISFESPKRSSNLSVVTVRRDETNYEVWIDNHLIANLPNQLQASVMQQRLNKLLQSKVSDPSLLRPATVDGAPAIMAGNRFLLGVNKEISSNTTRSADLIAIDWVNNLRSALKAPKLSLTEGQQDMYGLVYSNEKLSGLASWYGGYFHGRTTANGETYNQNDLTVAHKTLPFNTHLKVTYTKTGKSVIVRVNDRGPYIPPRSLDLSLAAARCIGSETAGVVSYEAVIMQPNQPKMTLNAPLASKDKKKPQQLAVVSEF
ncbi:septal ring lytic transglycosylase RlpA family protein [Dulcicalothrix desertica]|nr:septal ring lytic transglycosylase RlpA family protein [Dulcicalothrix desertica]TWH54502.1 rare lipoprotein A [Dulcicalothrix desertica PCC 7102]